LQGEVWRLVTWVVIPPSSLSIFTILMLMFYYNFGTALERTWGTYRYNVYLFSGMFFTILGSFVALFVTSTLYGADNVEMLSKVGASFFSTYYVNMSIFLASAVTFPDIQVLLMFIIPVKMKWMGIAYTIYLTYQTLIGTGIPYIDIFYRIAIVASLLNFVLYWIRSRRIVMSPKQIRRQQQFKSQIRKSSRVTTHKCATCGRTAEENEELEFRFCSKCNGNYEYCQDHLFTHEHVK
ncbi:hypothetical protein LJC58_09880, partial [Lachnospiraceae bacterium OttesenSCG-928-D06]|nr:hypothetical protein [Lachnospiraceae bacterium OttesenSCG-928-D06]